MPWANGRGTSYEIASDRNAGEWTWRLAMAPVNEDGAFSRFECVNRFLAVVEGAGMLLSVDRKKLQCQPMQVVRFRGDAITDATLTDGPITDINLMIRRKESDGEMAIVAEAGLLQGASMSLLLVEEHRCNAVIPRLISILMTRYSSVTLKKSRL